MGIGTKTESIAMAAFLALWGIFSAFMTVGTLKSNKVMVFVFASLTVLFFLLALGDATGNVDITHLAGYEGLICGASAIYLAMAEVLNESLGRAVLPIWPMGRVMTKEKPVEVAE